MHATSPRPRTGLEVIAEAVVAMAGYESSMAHAARALESMKLKIEGMGRTRGARGSHHGENGGGSSSGTADHAEGQTADLSVLWCGGCGFRALGECENGAGEAAARRRRG